MASNERIRTGDIVVGKALPWPVYDAGGILLLKKGTVIATERQLHILINRGMYRAVTESTPANTQHEAPEDNTSPFVHIADFCARLKQTFLSITNQSNDAESRIMRLAGDIQKLCTRDADALIGAVHLDHDNEYVYGHPIHVAILCEIFAAYLEIPQKQRLDIICAALLANVSIVALQAELHSQPGTLTDQQKTSMETHPLRSTALLQAAGVTRPVWLKTIEQHHERKDGTGYPRGLKGDDICKAAKLVGLGDIYSAMVVAKGYRDAHPASDILRVLFIDKDKEFDEELCLQFIKIMGVFPPGSFVRLDNGETAVVIKRAVNGNMWPTVASILSPRGGPYANPLRRNCNQDGYNIKEMVSLDRNVPLNLHKLWNYG